jgi:uncharacterized protein
MNKVLQCPKCQGAMVTHERHGVHIEQCGGCRGIFLDFGELESLTQLQSQWMQQQSPPPMQAPPMHAPPMQNQPGWGQQAGYGHGYRKPYKKSFMGMLFSS